MIKKNPLSFQLKVDDFLPATEEERLSLTQLRPSVSFFKDAMRRLRKNKVAMVSLIIIVVIILLAFVVPSFYPYSYEQQIKGALYLKPMAYSVDEQARIAAGEKIFPHILGTDNLGRDYAIRVMMAAASPFSSVSSLPPSFCSSVLFTAPFPASSADAPTLS